MTKAKTTHLSKHLPRLVLAAGLALTALGCAASAQAYDGYCYQRKAQAQTNGAIIGAVAGAAIGNGVAGRHERGAGTVAGALLGTAIGASAGRGSVDCYGGRYYSYHAGYYAPPPPPRGYTVVYYNEPPRYAYREVYRERYYYGGPGRYYGPPRGYYHPRGYGYYDGPHHHHDRW